MADALGAVPGGIFSPVVGFPTFPTGSLSDEDMGQINYLLMRLVEQRPVFDVAWNYYDGMQKMQDLGISIPPQLKSLRTVVGWPRVGIDALVHRAIVEGFRFPGATDVDDDLMGIWQANNLDGESSMTHLEALVSGRAYIIVGAPDDSTSGQPLITTESPRNMAVMYDARLRRVTAALQIWYDVDYSSDSYGYEVASFYTADKTVYMARQPVVNAGQALWEVTEVDQHNLGFVPVVRMANRQRLSNRSGFSEITAAWMNTVDSATRTLLGMEVSRELYGAPKRYLLGATEEMFQRPDGTALSKWQAAIDQVWALERDQDGNLPSVGEFQAASPTPFTQLIDSYTEIMAMNMGLPSALLGKNEQGNPSSADAIRVSYEELTARTRSKQTAFSEAWEQAMRYAVQIRDGKVDPSLTRLETDWRDAAPQTLAGTSDAITKQVQMGMLPASSDVALKRLGYSAVERARIAQERSQDEGESLLEQIASNIALKDVTSGTRLISDEQKAGVDGTNGPGAAGASASGQPGAADGGNSVAPAGPAQH